MLYTIISREKSIHILMSFATSVKSTISLHVWACYKRCLTQSTEYIVYVWTKSRPETRCR